MKEKSTNDLALRVDALKRSVDKLNSWEKQFVYNCDLTILRGIPLTTKQKLFLNDVEKRVQEISPAPRRSPKKKKPPKEKSKNKRGPKHSMFGPPPGTVFYSGDIPPWDDSLKSDWE